VQLGHLRQAAAGLAETLNRASRVHRLAAADDRLAIANRLPEERT
jgi:hypothetical protein